MSLEQGSWDTDLLEVDDFDQWFDVEAWCNVFGQHLFEGEWLEVRVICLICGNTVIECGCE